MIGGRGQSSALCVRALGRPTAVCRSIDRRTDRSLRSDLTIPHTTPHHRRAFLAQHARKLQAANAALQQTELFKSHDGGEEAAIFMAALMPGRAAHASELIPPRWLMVTLVG